MIEVYITRHGASLGEKEAARRIKTHIGMHRSKWAKLEDEQQHYAGAHGFQS
jgi:hypothetical protein